MKSSKLTQKTFESEKHVLYFNYNDAMHTNECILICSNLPNCMIWLYAVFFGNYTPITIKLNKNTVLCCGDFKSSLGKKIEPTSSSPGKSTPIAILRNI